MTQFGKPGEGEASEQVGLGSAGGEDGQLTRSEPDAVTSHRPAPDRAASVRSGLAAVTGLLIGGLALAIWTAPPFSVLAFPAELAALWGPPLLGLSMLLVLLAARPSRQPFGKGLSLLLILGAGMAAAGTTGVLMRGWSAPQEVDPAPDASVTVIAFNVFKANPVPARAARWLTNQQADIVVLLEDAEIGAGLAASFPYQITCSGENGRCATRLLSRLPPVAATGLTRGDANNREALSAASMTLCAHGRPIRLIGVHLSHPAPLGEQGRDVALLTTELEATAGGEVATVLVGDFNATPTSTGLSHLLAMADLERVPADGPTWPANARIPPLLSLDHVLTNQPALRISVMRGPRDLGSDHFPLIAQLDVTSLPVSEPCG